MEIASNKGVIADASTPAGRAGMSESEWREAIKFDSTDTGWVIMSIGMAIGAGIVFLPVQVGLIGAGTVLKPEQVDALARMGCQLIVTPNIHSEVIRRAVGYGMTVCPGCATATEAFTALEAGAQALKIFPSSAFGPQYIKALKAVLPPDIAVFAVGGVTPENLAQWIDAGCAGAGLGSDLYRAGQSVERTAQQAAAFVKAYREAVQ